MSWWKYALGGLGALFVAGEAHSVVTRTKGQKAKIGDIAFVQLIAVDGIVGDTIGQNALAGLRASTGSATGVAGQGALTLVPIKVESIGPIPPTSTAGGGFHQLRGTLQTPSGSVSIPIAVEFSAQAIQRLQRNGVDVQDGPHRLF